MKIGMIIILWFCLTGGLVVAQEKRAYTLFDADGQETDYAHMMSVLGEQQVVFIGQLCISPINTTCCFYRRDTQLPDSTLDGI